MSDFSLLTSLWLVPLVGSIAVLFFPRRWENGIRWAALGVSAATFVLSLVLFNAYLSPNRSHEAPRNVPLRQRAEDNVLGIDRSTREARLSLADLDLKEYDGNGNGMIEVREFNALPIEAFQRLDADRNGSIDSAEIRDAGANDLVVREPWIPYFNIQYYLGVDGISLSLIVLTGLISLLACAASWNIERQVKGYFSLFLLLLASMMGVFLALDLFLFYIFFEVMLLPMYFLIGIWGGPRREYAAIKFLLFTLFGSVFILVAVLILYFNTGYQPATLGGQAFAAHSFDALWLARAASETGYYSPTVQQWVFALFFIGFCIKLPSFPFHTWLPDAHVEAPTPISMILAGILLKIGGYGLIRMAWPLAPVGAYELGWYVALLGIVSILYGALVAMAQTDFKKLVAYSSVSHMGYVTLGMAVMTLGAGAARDYSLGVHGAMFMMIAHGITSAGMFFLVGVIYDRLHTRDLNRLGGLFNPMPLYGAVSFLIFFGSMGLPGLCGFIAEAFVVLSAYRYSLVLAILAASAVILTAGYILWTLQRVFLGTNDQYRGLPDLSGRETAIAIPLVVMTVVLGVLPQWSVFNWMTPSVNQVVNQVTTAKLLPGHAGDRPQTVQAAPRAARR